MTDHLKKSIEEDLGILETLKNPAAVAYYKELLGKISESPDKESEDEIEARKRVYIRNPPTIKEFVEDPYYLGNVLVPQDGEKTIFDFWQKSLYKDFDWDSKIHNLVITGSLGIGKCLCRNTLCLMYDGSTKAVQDLVAGDLLMGDDSTPREVQSTMVGRGPVYEIYPAKGEAFRCNGDHILCLKTSTSDIVTEVSVDDFLKWPASKRHAARIYRTGVEWEEIETSVDPYWLGLWLGDGTSRRVEITTMDSELHATFKNYAESFGLHENVYTAGSGARAKTYNYTTGRSGPKRPNKLLNLLRTYGLSRKDLNYEKDIPRDFLINSRQRRLELFAGLIDTDGSKSRGGKTSKSRRVKASNGVYEITVKGKKFADSIRFLAQSLGFFAQTKVKIVDSTAYYRTIVSGAYGIPSRLARKVSENQGESVSPLTGHIRKADCLKHKFAVIPLGEDDYFGFELDGNRRFLLGDFTVTHNTYIMVIIMLYRIALTTLLKDPQGFYGLGPGSAIIYTLISVTKAAVTETAFGDAMSFMANSPYFVEELGFDPNSLYTNFRIPLGKKRIMLTGGSKGHHLIGRNIIGVGLDEGNWRDSVEAGGDDKAYKLYDEIRTRINNRFRLIDGYLPAICIVASSARDESSFTESIIKEIEQSKDTHQKVYRSAVYKVKPEKLKLTDRWFKVSYGIKNVPPKPLKGWYYSDGTVHKTSEGEEAVPQGARVELVPDRYYPEFIRRPIEALQSVCGISTGGTNKLFSSMMDFESCIIQAEREGLSSPVIGGIEQFSLSEEDDKGVWDYLEHSKFLTKVLGNIQPLRHPAALRYVHLDLATKSMVGLSICHLTGNKLIKDLIKDGKPFSEYRLTVEYDFMLTFLAGTYKEISFQKIINFILWLRDKCGYSFGLVTADQFQSAAPLQTLEGAGFKVGRLSLDRNKEAYYTWRMGIEEHRVLMYRNEHLIYEAENLLDGDKKVDHPPNGCFTGETRVALADGTCPTFKELTERYNPEETFYVYAMSDAGVTIAPARHPRVTKKATELVEVLLDNYAVVRCTPDHLFMTLEGEWVRAENLLPDIRLMPLYRNASLKGGWIDYERVWCPVRNRRLLTHQLAAGYPDGTEKGFVIHHIDHCKSNNDPRNLELQSKADHAGYHTALRHQEDEDYVRKLREGHARYRENEGNEKSRENMLRLFEEGKLRKGKKECAIEGCYADARAKGPCGKHYASMRRSKKISERGKSKNHRILSIKRVVSDEDVYDLTVTAYENFALSSGIFVHNSKDLCDSAAGAYFNAINSDEKQSMRHSETPGLHMGSEEAPGKAIMEPIAINPPPTKRRIHRFEV